MTLIIARLHRQEEDFKNAEVPAESHTDCPVRYFFSHSHMSEQTAKPGHAVTQGGTWWGVSSHCRWMELKCRILCCIFINIRKYSFSSFLSRLGNLTMLHYVSMCICHGLFVSHYLTQTLNIYHSLLEWTPVHSHKKSGTLMKSKH